MRKVEGVCIVITMILSLPIAFAILIFKIANYFAEDTFNKFKQI